MTPIKWDSEADATLIRMRAAKAPFVDIAAAIGCSYRAAEERSCVLRRIGVDVWVGKTKRKRSPELIAHMRDMIRQGKTQRAVAAEIGVCQWTVSKWLNFNRPTVPRTPPALTTVRAEPEVKPVARGMGAIPAGDPVSWGAITRGTVLDGQEYPA